jgi:hypothetical protein
VFASLTPCGCRATLGTTLEPEFQIFLGCLLGTHGRPSIHLPTQGTGDKGMPRLLCQTRITRIMEGVITGEREQDLRGL